MPVSFKDLNKKNSDTLTKGFDSNHSVKVNTTTDNGVSFNAEVTAKGGNAVAGKVGAKFNHHSGFNVKKLELANNGTLTSDVTLTGAVDRTTFTLGVCMHPLDLSDANEKCEVGVEYSHDKFLATLSVSPLLPTAATASILVSPIDHVLVGGLYAGQLDETWQHTSGDVGLGYESGDSIFTVTSGKLFRNFTLSAFHKYSNDINFAASVGLDRNSPANANVTVGGSWAVDANTAFKAKVNVPNGSTDGSTASFGYRQKVNKNVALNVASRVTLDPRDDLFSASFALGLEFGNI